MQRLGLLIHGDGSIKDDRNGSEEDTDSEMTKQNL